MPNEENGLFLVLWFAVAAAAAAAEAYYFVSAFMHTAHTVYAQSASVQYAMQNNCSCFLLIFCFCCCAFKHISFVRNLGHIVFNVCAKIVLYCADRQNAVLFPFNVIIKSIHLKMSVHWHRDASLSLKICSPSIFTVSLNTQTANWHKYILFTINTSKSWEMQYQYNSLNLHRRLQCNVCMII